MESIMFTSDLLNKKCIPCEGIGKSFTKQEAVDLLKACPQWHLADDYKSISRDYVLKSFVQCTDRINKIKDIAEEQGHHPDLHLTSYKNLKVVLYTHALDGLTENDFIVAAKIDKLG